MCATCSSSFPSRTKLFQHLKQKNKDGSLSLCNEQASSQGLELVDYRDHDTDRVVVRYGDVFALMRDLRAMGATNPLVDRRRVPLKRRTLLRMAEIYHDRFADPDGRIRATFQIITLSGWAPHESQQKPLKPGSAKARLAHALKAVELPAGEKPGG